MTTHYAQTGVGLALVGLVSTTWTAAGCGGDSPCDKAVEEGRPKQLNPQQQPRHRYDSF